MTRFAATGTLILVLTGPLYAGPEVLEGTLRVSEAGVEIEGYTVVDEGAPVRQEVSATITEQLAKWSGLHVKLSGIYDREKGTYTAEKILTPSWIAESVSVGQAGILSSTNPDTPQEFEVEFAWRDRLRQPGWRGGMLQVQGWSFGGVRSRLSVHRVRISDSYDWVSDPSELRSYDSRIQVQLSGERLSGLVYLESTPSYPITVRGGDDPQGDVVALEWLEGQRVYVEGYVRDVYYSREQGRYLRLSQPTLVVEQVGAELIEGEGILNREGTSILCRDKHSELTKWWLELPTSSLRDPDGSLLSRLSAQLKDLRGWTHTKVSYRGYRSGNRLLLLEIKPASSEPSESEGEADPPAEGGTTETHTQGILDLVPGTDHP